jgi:hypothetical protein
VKIGGRRIVAAALSERSNAKCLPPALPRTMPAVACLFGRHRESMWYDYCSNFPGSMAIMNVGLRTLLRVRIVPIECSGFIETAQ